MDTIRLGCGENGRITIGTRYDQARVEKIKSISGRQWHPDQKVWSIPNDEGMLARLQTLFAGQRLEVDPALFPPLDEAVRRDIVDYLLLRPVAFYGKLELINFLKRVWDLSTLPSTDYRFQTAEGDIFQHMILNSDWDASYLLEQYLQLLDCDVATFLRFIEQTVHPIAIADEDEVRDRVSVFNDLLAPHGYGLREMKKLADRPVYRADLLAEGAHSSGEESGYEVVLSFAGEDRDYVQEVARILHVSGIRVFFDEDHEVELWGKDLTEELVRVYGGDSRYCVMFISKYYAQKMWPRLERRTALLRAATRGDDYLLPARFDNTEIDGLRKSIVYVDLATKTPSQLAEMIEQKVRGCKKPNSK